MDRRQRNRQKFIRGRVPSDARNTKTRSLVPSKLSERSFSAPDRARPVPLSRLSRRSAEARTRAIHVLAEMRHDNKLKLSSTARSLGVKPSVVKKYFGSALNKVDGRWRASKSDRFRETMYVPDARGNPVPVPTTK